MQGSTAVTERESWPELLPLLLLSRGTEDVAPKNDQLMMQDRVERVLGMLSLQQQIAPPLEFLDVKEKCNTTH